MNRDELLEMGYGWLVEGIGDTEVADDVQPWLQVQFGSAAERLAGRPGPVGRWRSAMHGKVQQIGALAALVAGATARATGAERRVTAADCQQVFEFLGGRGLLTSLCDPPR